MSVGEPAAGDSTAADGEPSARRHRLRRVAILVLEFVVVAALGWTLYRQRDGLAAILDVDLMDLVVVFVLTALAAPLRAIEFSTVTRTLDVKMTLVESLALTQAANLLNNLPLQAGNVLRARVLKRKRSLSYTRYVALMTTLVALGITACAMVGLAVLPVTGALAPAVRSVAGAAFAALLVGSAILAALPLHHLRLGRSWLALRFRALLDGWRQIKSDRRAITVLLATSAGTPILLGLRYWVCFQALSQSTGAAECILLATAVLVSAPVNITPSGLGVRELFGSALGAAAGLGFTEVLAAVTIDRGVMIIYSLLSGGTSLWLLRHRKMI